MLGLVQATVRGPFSRRSALCLLNSHQFARPCSSGSGRGPNSAWKTLNRLPTLDCISSDPLASATSGLFPPEIEALYRGNQRFRDTIAATTPDLLRNLAAKGQRPPFMLLDCSDSRVGEQVIFSAEPGTLFTTGNIANQFHEHDLNSTSVLAYAVDVLEVKHVIVMGHYGCGGVAVATQPPVVVREAAGAAVQKWIQPIRAIYEITDRPEIVRHREARKAGTGDDSGALPTLHDPAFRALVEENVKANVLRIARSKVIANHYASLPTHPENTGVFIHGWVYDIETGEVADLGVTVGPPGKEVPVTPFPTLSR